MLGRDARPNGTRLPVCQHLRGCSGHLCSTVQIIPREQHMSGGPRVSRLLHACCGLCQHQWEATDGARVSAMEASAMVTHQHSVSSLCSKYLWGNRGKDPWRGRLFCKEQKSQRTSRLLLSAVWEWDTGLYTGRGRGQWSRAPKGPRGACAAVLGVGLHSASLRKRSRDGKTVLVNFQGSS